VLKFCQIWWKNEVLNALKKKTTRAVFSSLNEEEDEQSLEDVLFDPFFLLFKMMLFWTF